MFLAEGGGSNQHGGKSSGKMYCSEHIQSLKESDQQNSVLTAFSW